MAPDPANNRVTLAVLGTKMDNLSELLQTHIANDRVAWRDHEDRILKNTQEAITMKQRMRTTTGLLGGLQLVLASISTWLGTR